MASGGAPSITLIGNANVDLVVRPVAELPPPGTERRVTTIDLRVGGAAAIGALTLAGLRVAASVVACVGDDLFGNFVIDALGLADVSVEAVDVRIGERTAVSIGMEAPGRDRAFLIDLGCLSGFERGSIPDGALRADAVMIGGYFLAPALRGAPTEEVLGEAKRNGARTFLDTGWDPDGWEPSTRREILGLLPLVDVFLPNLDEARALTGDPDVASAARTIHRASGGLVVVKLGPDGCIAIGPGGFEASVPAPRVDVTDTVGGGDAFNAGLIAALTEGSEPAEALAFACRVGSAVVSRASGSRYPSRSELPDR